jgi:hypothetical protein
MRSMHSNDANIAEVIPETPERRIAAAPALSLELHREALAGAVDPVTAWSGE